MSEMTPQQAADWIEKYEERSAEQRGGFGSLLFGGGPWGRAIRVLIDHARAAAPEGGDLADAADALAGAIDTHLGEECTLTDAVRDYPDDDAVWAAVSDLHGLRDRVRDALDRTPAPSVAAPPREDEWRTAIAISVEAALCHEKVHDSGGGDDAPVVWFDACDHSSEPEWPCRAAYGVADALLAGTVRDPGRAT